MVESRMTISGNLTRDPQLRVGSKTGEPFAVLAVAVNNRRFDRAAGQWVTTGTTYFDVLCWNAAGANALSSLKKGDPVIAHGRFRLKQWTSEKGNGANATIDADSIGPDLAFGRAPFTRGNAGFGLDRVDDFDPGAELDAEGGVGGLARYADADGVVDDEGTAAILSDEGTAAILSEDAA